MGYNREPYLRITIGYKVVIFIKRSLFIRNLQIVVKLTFIFDNLYIINTLRKQICFYLCLKYTVNNNFNNRKAEKSNYILEKTLTENKLLINLSKQDKTDTNSTANELIITQMFDKFIIKCIKKSKKLTSKLTQF